VRSSPSSPLLILTSVPIGRSPSSSPTFTTFSCLHRLPLFRPFFPLHSLPPLFLLLPSLPPTFLPSYRLRAATLHPLYLCLPTPLVLVYPSTYCEFLPSLPSVCFLPPHPLFCPPSSPYSTRVGSILDAVNGIFWRFVSRPFPFRRSAHTLHFHRSTKAKTERDYYNILVDLGTHLPLSTVVRVQVQQ
jgi:hypothetical protein